MKIRSKISFNGLLEISSNFPQSTKLTSESKTLLQFKPIYNLTERLFLQVNFPHNEIKLYLNLSNELFKYDKITKLGNLLIIFISRTSALTIHINLLNRQMSHYNQEI